MMNFINDIYIKLKNSLKNSKNYLRLTSIKKNGESIFCEFNEILRLDGKLIRFDIDEIATNKNIQESIEPDMLFIIGTLYGKHQVSLKEYRIKLIDMSNETMTLENKDEKILISINSFLMDSHLIQQVNQLDLVRLLYPYAHQLGYKMHQSILSCEKENALLKNHTPNDTSNIVNLF